MFVLQEPDLIILQASENTLNFLGIAVDDLIGEPLQRFLDDGQVDRVRFALGSSEPFENNPVPLSLVSTHTGQMLDGIAHRHDGFTILELEPTPPPASTHFLDFYRNVSRSTSRLQAATTLQALAQEGAAAIRTVTGFDRVMIYRFSGSGEGEVIAEARIDTAESYLGLWFPASDIPEQARRMYTLSPIRAIPDVSYIPVPIVPVINPVSERPADLSFAGLRSVSPVHCEYLRNMGVTASMSISILRDGKLWGLVACHHFSSRFVPYEVLKSCTFLGQVLSREIARREGEEKAADTIRSMYVRAQFLEHMAASDTPLFSLLSLRPNLLDFIRADGAAVVVEGEMQSLGSTPDDSALRTLLQSLRRIHAPPTFCTRSLRNHFSTADLMRDTSSGLIALEISRTPEQYILFFRAEHRQTVTWAGNPEKPVIPSEDGDRLNPRTSFAAWQETVSGVSRPWSEEEMRAADELRRLVTVVLMKNTTALPLQP